MLHEWNFFNEWKPSTINIWTPPLDFPSPINSALQNRAFRLKGNLFTTPEPVKKTDNGSGSGNASWIHLGTCFPSYESVRSVIHAVSVLRSQLENAICSRFWVRSPNFLRPIIPLLSQHRWTRRNFATLLFFTRKRSHPGWNTGPELRGLRYRQLENFQAVQLFCRYVDWTITTRRNDELAPIPAWPLVSFRFWRNLPLCEGCLRASKFAPLFSMGRNVIEERLNIRNFRIVDNVDCAISLTNYSSSFN